MGCEGYITLSRVSEGYHLIKDDYPHFIAKEKVAIIPAFGEYFGKHLNIRTRYNNINYSCEDYNPHLDIIILDGAEFGIVVMPRTSYCQFFNDKKGCDRNVGNITESENIMNWDKIIPGVWLVGEYHDTGMGEYNHHYYRKIPDGVVITDTVHYEIWT